MICYCEIQPADGSTYAWETPQLMDKLKSTFNLVKSKANLEFYRKQSIRLYAGIVKEKKHIYEYLKHVLFSTNDK